MSLQRPATLTTAVATYIRDAIVHGVFAPGSRLPEVALASQLETSRGTVREALRTLAEGGLIQINQDIERAAGGIPVTHVTVTRDPDEATNILVIANQTVLSDELLDRIRKRAAKGEAAFLIVAPQGDNEQHEDADRRLRRALSDLRGEGIDAHGQIVHPDPHTAAMHVVNDERVDEIIVSTFPGERSGWLRRDLVERLRRDTKLPVDHVISPVPQRVEARA